ncbi:hypothetical protein AGMMS49949_05340 [Alphaproteobacteria bacterium]|nr:hypothetical protein AGMMS49949_05340 [Alphaproteobacteria bacterium]
MGGNPAEIFASVNRPLEYRLNELRENVSAAPNLEQGLIRLKGKPYSFPIKTENNLSITIESETFTLKESTESGKYVVVKNEKAEEEGDEESDFIDKVFFLNSEGDRVVEEESGKEYTFSTKPPTKTAKMTYPMGEKIYTLLLTLQGGGQEWTVSKAEEETHTLPEELLNGLFNFAGKGCYVHIFPRRVGLSSLHGIPRDFRQQEDGTVTYTTLFKEIENLQDATDKVLKNLQGSTDQAATNLQDTTDKLNKKGNILERKINRISDDVRVLSNFERGTLEIGGKTVTFPIQTEERIKINVSTGESDRILTLLKKENSNEYNVDAIETEEGTPIELEDASVADEVFSLDEDGKAYSLSQDGVEYSVDAPAEITKQTRITYEAEDKTYELSITFSQSSSEEPWTVSDVSSEEPLPSDIKAIIGSPVRIHTEQLGLSALVGLPTDLTRGLNSLSYSTLFSSLEGIQSSVDNMATGEGGGTLNNLFNQIENVAGNLSTVEQKIDALTSESHSEDAPANLGFVAETVKQLQNYLTAASNVPLGESDTASNPSEPTNLNLSAHFEKVLKTISSGEENLTGTLTTRVAESQSELSKLFQNVLGVSEGDLEGAGSLRDQMLENIRLGMGTVDLQRKLLERIDTLEHHEGFSQKYRTIEFLVTGKIPGCFDEDGKVESLKKTAIFIRKNLENRKLSKLDAEALAVLRRLCEFIDTLENLFESSYSDQAYHKIAEILLKLFGDQVPGFVGKLQPLLGYASSTQFFKPEHLSSSHSSRPHPLISSPSSSSSSSKDVLNPDYGFFAWVKLVVKDIQCFLNHSTAIMHHDRTFFKQQLENTLKCKSFENILSFEWNRETYRAIMEFCQESLDKARRMDPLYRNFEALQNYGRELDALKEQMEMKINLHTTLIQEVVATVKQLPLQIKGELLEISSHLARARLDTPSFLTRTRSGSGFLLSGMPRPMSPSLRSAFLSANIRPDGKSTQNKEKIEEDEDDQ